MPRLLMCGHTLCHSCLTRLPQTQENPNLNLAEEPLVAIRSIKTVIFCPFDRQPTTLGPNGVWDLKKNFALLELLEKLEENERETNLALDKERELSVSCDENEDHTAVVYCTTCATHLCEQVGKLQIHFCKQIAKSKQKFPSAPTQPMEPEHLPNIDESHFLKNPEKNQNVHTILLMSWNLLAWKKIVKIPL